MPSSSRNSRELHAEIRCRLVPSGVPVESGRTVKPLPRCCRIFGLLCAARRSRGNRDEESSVCRIDRGIVDLARSESPGACRGCRSGRRIGRGGPGTRGRGGGCVDRVHCGTFDLALVGSPAVRIVVPGATGAIQPCCATTGVRGDQFTATCQGCGEAVIKNSRAAGPGT